MKLLDAVKYLAPLHKQLPKNVQVFLTGTIAAFSQWPYPLLEIRTVHCHRQFRVHQKFSRGSDPAKSAKRAEPASTAAEDRQLGDVKNSWRKS